MLDTTSNLCQRSYVNHFMSNIKRERKLFIVYVSSSSLLLIFILLPLLPLLPLSTSKDLPDAFGSGAGMYLIESTTFPTVLLSCLASILLLKSPNWPQYLATIAIATSTARSALGMSTICCMPIASAQYCLTSWVIPSFPCPYGFWR